MTLTETPESRSGEVEGNQESYEREFIVTDAADEAAALVDLVTNAPATVGSLPLRGGDVEEIAPGFYKGIASYSSSSTQITAPTVEGPGNDTSQFGFQVSGQNKRVFHVTDLADQVSYTVGGNPSPEVNGGINVEAPGKYPSGVDILVPELTFTEVHFLEAAFVTPAYKLLMATLVGSMNDDTFKGFAAGEVLSRGVRGTLRADGSWELAYDFSARPSVNDTIVGVPNVVARGHDYVWVMWEQQDDVAAKRVLPKPVGVYAAKLYELTDFSQFGIGV